MTITSQDCKDYIVQKMSDDGFSTQSHEWKRVKKFKLKDSWIRIFKHPVRGEILIEECQEQLSIVQDKKEEVFSSSHLAEVLSKNQAQYLNNLISLGLNLDSEIQGLPLLSYCIIHKLDKCFDLLMEQGANFMAPDYLEQAHPVAFAAKSPYIHFLRSMIKHPQFDLLHPQNGDSLSALIFNGLNKRNQPEEFDEILKLFNMVTFKEVLLPTFETMIGKLTTQTVIEYYKNNPTDMPAEHPLFVHLFKNEKFDLATQYYQTLNINPHEIKINQAPLKQFFNSLNNTYANNHSDNLKPRFYAIQAFFTSIQHLEIKKPSNNPLLKKKKF